MVIEALVSGLLVLVDWLVGLLPSGSSWAPSLTPVASVFANLHAVNAYLPISEAMTCAGIAITIQGARYGFALVLFLYRRVRG